MKVKTESVRISELKLDLFVRKELNQDHVLFLAELLENGVELPPVKITKDRRLIDGRHRKEAYELNNRTHIEAIIDSTEDEVRLISMAYQANLGGSLPPTSQDTEHTIALLLARGETMKRIGELLALPTPMARRFAKDVQSKMAQAKLTSAVDAITNGGLTVARAAEQYGVDIDQLKEKLSGQRKKHRQVGVAEIQRRLTQTHKSLSSKIAALIRSLLEKFEDGDVNERQVRDIFAHIEQLKKRSSRGITDWKKRFDAMVHKTKANVKAEEKAA
jgi:hypothetical protein